MPLPVIAAPPIRLVTTADVAIDVQVTAPMTRAYTECALALAWLTAAVVAKRLSFTRAHVLELCRTGDIPSVKVGKYVRIPEDRFTAWRLPSAGIVLA